MIAMLSLIRMFGPRGNPQARNLFGIMGSSGDAKKATSVSLLMNKPPTRALRAFDKWGEAPTPGFQLVPAKLELSHTDMLVLLNVLMHWWYADKRPFPRSTTIAPRRDVQPRTVQRSLARLDELGLVQRVIEELPDGEEQQVCDPSGLRQRLIELARTAPAFGTTVSKQGDVSDVF